MSEDHKAALAKGRRESRAIRNYLEALGSRKPGRPITPESLKKRIDGLEKKIESETNQLKKVELRQSRLDAEEALAKMENASDLEELEKEFAKVAKSYSKRKGITYSAWREQGVPAAVLKKAGVSRGG
jgi:chromosome segregation ATPase